MIFYNDSFLNYLYNAKLYSQNTGSQFEILIKILMISWLLNL